MNDYRVAKLEAPATLYLTNSRVMRGTVFLAEFSANHSGPETVLDLVRSAEPMLPMLDLSGRFVLLGRNHVVAIEVAAEFAGAQTLSSEVAAQIETSGGHTFVGDLHVPNGFGDRISDAFNGTFEWHALRSGSAVTWLSRQHIVKARTDT